MQTLVQLKVEEKVKNFHGPVIKKMWNTYEKHNISRPTCQCLISKWFLWFSLYKYLLPPVLNSARILSISLSVNSWSFDKSSQLMDSCDGKSCNFLRVLLLKECCLIVFLILDSPVSCIKGYHYLFKNNELGRKIKWWCYLALRHSLLSALPPTDVKSVNSILYTQ